VTDAGEPDSDPSHAQLVYEIRTLLAAIRDQVELLRYRVANGRTDQAPIGQGLQRIEAAATQVSQLVYELAESRAPQEVRGAGLRPALAHVVQFDQGVEPTNAAAEDEPVPVYVARAQRPRNQQPGYLPLSSLREADSVVRAVQAGAMRYLLNESNAQEWWQAIKAVVVGQVQLSPEPAARLAHDVLAPEQLSQRELDVLRLVARGHSNKHIAHDLMIAENTVKSHVSSILGKLGVESRTHAAEAWIVCCSKRLQ
jgi:DNA-binding NarL/FixJ family response regulator